MSRNENGDTPLIEALLEESLDVTKFLIERGADLNMRSEEFKTPPFHDACIWGNMEIVELMIKKKVDIKAVDIHGQNALEVAAMYGNKKVYERLLKLGMTSRLKAHVAAGLGDLVELKKHRDQINGRTPGWKETPLQYACSAGQVEACRFLLSNGADVHLKNVLGMTAMHFAAMILDEEKGKQVIDRLLSAGAFINAKDNDGSTPLDYAGDVMDYMITKGAREGDF